MLVALAAPPFMFCAAPSRVASMRKPVDATHAGAGSVTLASGASFEIEKGAPGQPPSEDDTFFARLRASDRVQMCYAPPQRFADAGPSARMAIAGVVRTGDAIYVLAYPAPSPH